MRADGAASAVETANRRPDVPTLPGVLAIVAVLAGFAIVDPLLGVGGAVIVGACRVLFGPVPAFAVGQFVAVGLAPTSLPALVVVQTALVTLLLGTLPSAVAPVRHLAAGGVAFGAVGLASAAAWLWTDSVSGAALAGLLSVALGVYAVYRYEVVSLGPPPG